MPCLGLFLFTLALSPSNRVAALAIKPRLLYSSPCLETLLHTSRHHTAKNLCPPLSQLLILSVLSLLTQVKTRVMLFNCLHTCSLSSKCKEAKHLLFSYRSHLKASSFRGPTRWWVILPLRGRQS